MKKNRKKSRQSTKKAFAVLMTTFFSVVLLLTVAKIFFSSQEPNTVLGASTTNCPISCSITDIFCELAFLQRGCLSPMPTTTPAPSPQSSKGLYQFVGTNNASNATKPYLAGALLNYYWSQIEPTKGNYNWSQIKNDMQPWTSAGKKVILRISMSGNCYPNQPGSCSRTPDWVYAEGVHAVVDKSGAKYPNFFDPIYQKELQNFIAEYARQFDNDPQVAYINAAVANDGEKVISKDASNQAYALWQPLGYTDKKWLAAIKTIIGFYGQSFQNKLLAIQPDKTFIQPKTTKDRLSEMALLQAVVALQKTYPNLMFQNDSLFANQKLAGIWNSLPLSLEQGQVAGNSTTLQNELQVALNEKASYILIFSSDINNPANQSILQNFANKLQ